MLKFTQINGFIIILFMSSINIKEITQKLAQQSSIDLDQQESSFAIIGATGSGKSTLLNLLLGYKLTFQKKPLGYVIKDSTQRKNAPQIGNSNESCTECASLYFDEKKNAFFDCAGYFDTKGVNQEIINGIANSKIFKKGRKIKLIMVIDINSLTEKRGKFISDFVLLLKSQFGNDFEFLAKSTMIVFSKVNTSGFQMEDIQAVLDEMIFETDILDESGKLFLQVVLRNKQIVIFPAPNKKFQEYISQIKTVASSLKETYLSLDAQVTISDLAKHQLIQMKGQTELTLKKIQQKVCQNLDHTFKKEVQKEFQDKYKALTYAKGVLSTAQNNNEIVELLGRLAVSDFLTNQLKSSLYVHEFCDKICESINKRYNFEILSGNIRQLLSFYELLLEKNSSAEQKKKMQEKLNKILVQNEKNYQRKIEEMKRNEARVLQQIESQKQALEEEFQEFQKKKKEKIARLQQQIRKQEIQNQKIQMQLMKQQKMQPKQPYSQQRTQPQTNYTPSSSHLGTMGSYRGTSGQQPVNYGSSIRQKNYSGTTGVNKSYGNTGYSGNTGQFESSTKNTVPLQVPPKTENQYSKPAQKAEFVKIQQKRKVQKEEMENKSIEINQLNKNKDELLHRAKLIREEMKKY